MADIPGFPRPPDHWIYKMYALTDASLFLIVIIIAAVMLLIHMYK